MLTHIPMLMNLNPKITHQICCWDHWPGTWKDCDETFLTWKTCSTFLLLKFAFSVNLTSSLMTSVPSWPIFLTSIAAFLTVNISMIWTPLSPKTRHMVGLWFYGNIAWIHLSPSIMFLHQASSLLFSPHRQLLHQYILPSTYQHLGKRINLLKNFLTLRWL